MLIIFSFRCLLYCLIFYKLVNEVQRTDSDTEDAAAVSFEDCSKLLDLARNVHHITLKFDKSSLRSHTSIGDLAGSSQFTYIGPPADATVQYYALSRLSNMPATGSPTLTIVGYGFTMADATPTFRSAGTVAEATSWVADTVVIARAASGSGYTGGIALSIEEYVNTETEAHSYDYPRFSALRSRNHMLSQAKFLADGKNFASKETTVRTAISLSSSEATRWFSDTSVSVTRSAGISQTRRMSITVGFGRGTISESYSFDQPATAGLIWQIFVQYVNLNILIGVPNFPAVAKGSFFIVGTSFGLSHFSSQGRAGFSAEAVTVWFSTTLVSCKVVSGLSGSHHAVLTAGSELKLGSSSAVLSYDDPRTAFILVTNAPMSGSSSIIISGIDFGAQQKSLGAREIASGCESTYWMSDTSTGTRVAAMQNYPTGVSFKTAVTSGVLVGTFLNSLTYDTPSISILMPANFRPARGTSLVTIIGSRVAQAGSSARARLGSTACERSVWQSASGLLCGSPSGIGDFQGMQVTIGGQVGQFSLSFTYDQIMISALQRRNSPSSSFPFLTVYGSGMAIVDYTPKLSFAATSAEASKWSSDSTVLTRPASGFKSTTSFASNIVATVGVACQMVWASSGFNSEAILLPIDPSICPQSIETFSITEAFSYDVAVPIFVSQPSLLKALTSFYAGTLNTDRATISGVGFGISDYSESLTVGRTNCELSLWSSTTSVFCKVASGVGGSFPLVFTSGSAVGRTGSVAFTYLGPNIFVQSPALAFIWKFNHPVTGSTPITVQAVFLGLFSVTQDLRTGASDCEGTMWVSDTALTGIITAGVGATKMIAVTTGQEAGSTSFAWSYDAPIVSQSIVSPLTQYVATLLGTGMASSDFTPGMPHNLPNMLEFEET